MKKNAQQTNEVAKDRLRSVLQNDRGYLAGKSLEYFRRDVATVLLSYMEFEEDALQVEFGRGEGGAQSLCIQVPTVRIRKKAAAFQED